MTEITERRVRHLKTLQANHNRDFWSRFGNQDLEPEAKVVRLSDALSADWNRKQKATEGAPAMPPPVCRRPLPKGWRIEHWKTQQAMAVDYTGVRPGTKLETIRVLEAYENASDLPPAA